MKGLAIAIVATTFAMSSAANAQASASPGDCELHVWPTESYNVQAMGLLFGFGLLGALADHEGHKDERAVITDYLRADLDPAAQVEELRRADAAKVLGLPGYRIVAEPATPSRNTAKAAFKAMKARLKSRERLSTSTAPCYAELVGTDILYHRAPMYGSNLFATWTFRRFDQAGGAKPKTNSGRVKNPLEDFPPKTSDKVEAARTEVRGAYRADFLEYVQKKVLGAASPSSTR